MIILKKLLTIYTRTIYISSKGYEKNSLSLDTYLDLSFLRYEIYLKQIWDKDLNLNLNKSFGFSHFKISKNILLTLNLESYSKFKVNSYIYFSKIYKNLFFLIKNIKFDYYTNILDSFSIKNFSVFNSIIDTKLNLLNIQLNNFKDILTNLSLMKIKKIDVKKNNLKQVLLPYINIISKCCSNKRLNIEIFDFVELCSTNFFISYLIDILNYRFLSKFKKDNQNVIL